MARKKNPRIKPANTEHEFTHDQVRELKLCANDPVHFIENYVMIQHPTKGAVPFKLYPYQKKMLRAYKENRYTVVLSARQTGKSVTSAAYLLWYAVFHFDKTILIASNKNANAMEMILRIRYAYENLPHWIKPGVTEDGWNKHNIGFDNDSRIISTATSEDAGRGMAISLLFLDEFAFVAPGIQQEFWKAIAPTLSTGGSCIMTSTPNGDMNIFAEIWRGANIPDSDDPLVGVNGFYPIQVVWDEPPGRDEKFKEEQIAKLGEHTWRQEYLCEFLSSDALLIDSMFLARLTAGLQDVFPLRTVKDVVFFKDVVADGTYLVGVDPATGSGEDYSVITIYDFPTLEQVGEYRSNSMSTNALYSVLKNILFYLEKFTHNIYFSVENNGVGEGIISLYEADERPPEIAEFISEVGKDRRGIYMTKKTKIRACINFKEMLERGNIHIKSKVLLAELKSFTRRKGSYEAQIGSTDDCVTASLIIIRILEEIASYDQVAFDKLYTNNDFSRWSASEYDGYDGEYSDEPDELPIAF